VAFASELLQRFFRR